MDRTIYAILEEGLKGNIPCEVILNLDQSFRRRCRLKEKFTDDGRSYLAHLEPSFGSGELKMRLRGRKFQDQDEFKNYLKNVGPDKDPNALTL